MGGARSARARGTHMGVLDSPSSVEPAMSFPHLLMQVIEAQPEVQSHVQNMHSESRADNQAPFPPSQIFMNDRE